MASAVYVTQTQGMSDLIATQRSAQTIKKCTMVPFFGAKSSWFGWEKLVFSLGFHLRLWPGSFWGIQHLPELKIAKKFFFHGFRASCDDRVVLTTGRASGIWFSTANRAIVVGFWWFLQRWKALEKVDEECHPCRALATTFRTENPVWIPVFLFFEQAMLTWLKK